MITDNSFFDYKGNDGVAISRTVPKGWKGRRYTKLAPTDSLLTLWKGGYLEEEDYILIYKRDVLSRLDRKKTRRELGENAVLLCWERKGFCHRYIAVEWLNNTKGEI